LWLLLALLGAAGGCVTPESDPDCEIAAEGCTCTKGGTCDSGLSCLSGFCVLAEGTTTRTTSPDDQRPMNQQADTGDPADSDADASLPPGSPEEGTPPEQAPESGSADNAGNGGDGCDLCMRELVAQPGFGAPEGITSANMLCDDGSARGLRDLVRMEFEDGQPSLFNGRPCGPRSDYDPDDCSSSFDCFDCSLTMTHSWNDNATLPWDRGGWSVTGTCSDTGKSYTCAPNDGTFATNYPYLDPFHYPACSDELTPDAPLTACSWYDIILIEAAYLFAWCGDFEWTGGCGCYPDGKKPSLESMKFAHCLIDEIYTQGSSCFDADRNCGSYDAILSSDNWFSTDPSAPIFCSGLQDVSGGGSSGGSCTNDTQCGSCSRCADGTCRFCGYGPAGFCTC